jgi:Glycosyl transferases group 1
MTRARVLLLFATSANTSTFSYHQAWPRHFQSSPAFDCTPVNVGDQGWAARLRALAAITTWRGDLIVILHSVFSNACLLEGRLFDAVRRRREPKAYFIGNEYKLMPEKMTFCDQLPVSLLVSQSSAAAVHQLYRDRLHCQVIGLPNTGYDPALFSPSTPDHDRDIDLGYRADDAPPYLGHNERREIAEFFQQHAGDWGLRVDISLDPADRFNETEWAAFLNRCRGQLGTEAGGDFFTLDDDRRLFSTAYERAHPGVSKDDVRTMMRDFPKRGIPLRIISGRNIEAAGTKTVQVLFEGEYDGYFQPDEHYIPLRKDFGNAGEAIAKFKDPALRSAIADNAYRLISTEFTYDRLLSRFAAAAADVA